MTDKKASILDEPIMGIKVKYWLSALMFIAGVALVIIAVVTGVVDGFEGNYIKLIVGLFLMAYLMFFLIKIQKDLNINGIYKRKQKGFLIRLRKNFQIHMLRRIMVWNC